jgi:hypothetical protein
MYYAARFDSIKTRAKIDSDNADRLLEHLMYGAGWMFILGLIGTLIGLGISLAKVNLTNIREIDGIVEIAVQLIVGLRVEISASILGAIFGLWTEVNYVFLKRNVI